MSFNEYSGYPKSGHLKTRRVRNLYAIVTTKIRISDNFSIRNPNQPKSDDKLGCYLYLYINLYVKGPSLTDSLDFGSLDFRHTGLASLTCPKYGLVQISDIHSIFRV